MSSWDEKFIISVKENNIDECKLIWKFLTSCEIQNDAFLLCCQLGHSEILEWFLVKQISNVKTIKSKLKEACRDGKIKIVSVILHHNKKYIHTICEVLNNHKDTIEFLLTSDIYEGLQEKHKNHCHTLIVQSICCSGDVEMLKWYLKSFKEHIRSQDFFKGYLYAASCSKIPMVKYLIENKLAPPFYEKGKALINLCKKETELEDFKWLFEQDRKNFSSIINELFVKICECNNIKIGKYLYDMGIDVNYRDGYVFLTYSAEWLIEIGADFYSIDKRKMSFWYRNEYYRKLLNLIIKKGYDLDKFKCEGVKKDIRSIVDKGYYITFS